MGTCWRSRALDRSKQRKIAEARQDHALVFGSAKDQEASPDGHGQMGLCNAVPPTLHEQLSQSVGGHHGKAS